VLAGQQMPKSPAREGGSPTGVLPAQSGSSDCSSFIYWRERRGEDILYGEHYFYPGKLICPPPTSRLANLSPIPFFFLKSDPVPRRALTHELFACRPLGLFFSPCAPNARSNAFVPALPAQVRALRARASAYSSSELLVRPRRVPADEQNRWRCRAGIVVEVERMVDIAAGAGRRRSGHGCGCEAVPCAARESERS